MKSDRLKRHPVNLSRERPHPHHWKTQPGKQTASYYARLPQPPPLPPPQCVPFKIQFVRSFALLTGGADSVFQFPK